MGAVMVTRKEMSRIHRNSLFRALLESEGATIQELSERMCQSIPTITSYLKYLEKENLVGKKESEENTGGRRAKLYLCNTRAYISIGVDITKNHLCIVFVDLHGDIIYSSEREKLGFRDTENYYRDIRRKIKKQLKKSGICENQVLGIGVSLPCIVKSQNNDIVYSKVLGECSSIFPYFIDSYTIPVRLFNDANSAGFAEKYKKDIKDLTFYMMLSNSVGGAILQKNEIYEGDNSRGGEIGHVRIVPGGRKCYCGQEGCINVYCSAERLAELYQGNLGAFFQAVEARNKKATKALEEYLEYLSTAIINIRMLLDCDIILGGYVGNYLEPFAEKISEKVREKDPFSPNTEYIHFCKKQEHASAMGSALWFISDFISRV